MIHVKRFGVGLAWLIVIFTILGGLAYLILKFPIVMAVIAVVLFAYLIGIIALA